MELMAGLLLCHRPSPLAAQLLGPSCQEHLSASLGLGYPARPSHPPHVLGSGEGAACPPPAGRGGRYGKGPQIIPSNPSSS